MYNLVSNHQQVQMPILAKSFPVSTTTEQENFNSIKPSQNPFGPFIPTQDALGTILSIVTKKTGEIVTQAKNEIVQGVTNFDLQQKINTAKITKLLIDNHSLKSLTDAKKHKAQIEELAKYDYKTIEDKYNAIKKNYEQDGISYETDDIEYNYKMHLVTLFPILTYEKLKAEDIDEICMLSKNLEYSPALGPDTKLELSSFVSTLKSYDNFDMLSTSEQAKLIHSQSDDDNFYDNVSVADAKMISDASSLMKFDYFRDLKSANTREEFIDNLKIRMQNTPCSAISTSNYQINKVLSSNAIKELEGSLKDVDLTKYQCGLPLDYSRDTFINDFTNLTKNMSANDKKKLYDKFSFKIDTSGDIINYPNPNVDLGQVDDSIKDVAIQAQELINKFMLENSIHLAPEDKALEDALNEIIKAFPEFISIIGKKQHRGDSIDYHTLDDLQRVYSNHEYSQLSEDEKRILTVATLFHDFGKAQNMVDEGHARKSAILTKEIIKKTPLSLDEKERIFNLINHSHWLVDGSSNEDIGFIFRRPNDFKMAEIFEQADSNSAGFPYEPNLDAIEAIKRNIDIINTTGIPLFADNLPTDESLYDRTPSGIKYLDLRDPEASVEKYGYPAGTKVKDLKFLCHSALRDYVDTKSICDDSKEVCLSTSLLDVSSKFNTRYNGGTAYILSGNNSNIVLGGKLVACTGGQRGYDYAKNMSYSKKDDRYLGANPKARAEIPTIIKENLNLTDEEYLEVYNNICNLQRLVDIQDIQLANGRTITKEDLVTEIKKVQDRLINQNDNHGGSYINEVVVYNPKVEALVSELTPEELNTQGSKDNVYVLV